MSKLKALAKDKRVVTGIIVAVTIAAGVAIDPLLLDQIVTAITSLAI